MLFFLGGCFKELQKPPTVDGHLQVEDETQQLRGGLCCLPNVVSVAVFFF